jgi:Ca2+-binding RTX toxin-like protein
MEDLVMFSRQDKARRPAGWLRAYAAVLATGAVVAATLLGAAPASAAHARSKPQAQVSASGSVLSSGKGRVTVRTDASKVKVTYRTAKGSKKTTTVTTKRGTATATIPALSRSVTVQALSSSRVGASAAVGVALAYTEDGRPCTIVGTPKSDKLSGGSGSDVICGLAGNDTIDAKGGNDVLDGGTGNDRLQGSHGSDTILTGSGTDLAHGGSGDDTVIGAQGIDTIYGDDGQDVLRGNDADDVLSGGPGNDALDGGPGHDRLDGGPGDNLCDRDAGETEVSTCRYDAQAPQVVSVEVPAQVRAGESVAVRFRITDATGVEGWRAMASVRGPAGNSLSPSGGTRRVSGDDRDATYEAVFAIPASAPDGTYQVTIHATDHVGNVTPWNPAGDATFTVVR